MTVVKVAASGSTPARSISARRRSMAGTRPASPRRWSMEVPVEYRANHLSSPTASVSSQLSACESVICVVKWYMQQEARNLPICHRRCSLVAVQPVCAILLGSLPADRPRLQALPPTLIVEALPTTTRSRSSAVGVCRVSCAHHKLLELAAIFPSGGEARVLGDDALRLLELHVGMGELVDLGGDAQARHMRRQQLLVQWVPQYLRLAPRPVRLLGAAHRGRLVLARLPPSIATP
uniref:Uncharacterized protein n=1 Tax=Oryza brachyantha TaxID=4533 RepID=J3N205_ORYBR